MQQDKRTIKTERAIRQAFMQLLRKKDFTAVTVSDICEAACISRNTFYSHYADKYLLLDRITEEFSQGLLTQVFEKNADNDYRASVAVTSKLFFDYLEGNRELVRMLSANNAQFWQVFSQHMQEFMLGIAGDDDRTRVSVVYSCSALTGCYRAYYEGKIAQSPGDFVRYITEISTRANEFMDK